MRQLPRWQLLADLRTIMTKAGSLPALQPERDLWSGIAARIEAPVVALNDAATIAPRRVLSWRVAGMAAAAIVVVTTGITYEVTRRDAPRLGRNGGDRHVAGGVHAHDLVCGERSSRLRSARDRPPPHDRGQRTDAARPGDGGAPRAQPGHDRLGHRAVPRRCAESRSGEQVPDRIAQGFVSVQGATCCAWRRRRPRDEPRCARD